MGLLGFNDQEPEFLGLPTLADAPLNPALVQEPPAPETPFLPRFFDQIKRFATSDTGRGLSQALGVGLLGFLPDKSLQKGALDLLLKQGFEQEKQRTIGKQAASVAQLHAKLLERIQAGDRVGALKLYGDATSNPELMATMGANLSTLAPAMTKLAEEVRQSDAYKQGLAAVGGSTANITSAESLQRFLAAFADNPEKGIAIAKLFNAPYLQERDLTPQKGPNGELLYFTDKSGRTFVPGREGGKPVPGPPSTPGPKLEALTVENVLKGSPHAADLLSRAEMNIADVVNEANKGSSRAKEILGQVGVLSAEMSKRERESKATFQPVDTATAQLSIDPSTHLPKYRTFAELLTAAQGGDRGAASLIPRVNAHVQGLANETKAAGEMAKLDFEMTKKPLRMQEGFRSSTILNKKTLEEDNSATARQAGFVEGVPATHKVLSEQDTKLLSGMKVIERAIPLLSEIAGRLATTPAGVIKQRVDALFSKEFGIPSIGGLADSVQALKLRVAASFQGANAQLSDRDVQAIEGLMITKSDSQATAGLKIAALKAITKIVKAGLADSEPAMVEALKEYRSNIGKLFPEKLTITPEALR